MSRRTGTLSKNLEEKAVEIEINETLTKVVSVEGSVESVSGFNEPIILKIDHTTIVGYQKKLHINLDPETSTECIGLLKFKGTSPVKGGDRIKAGLILEEYFKRYRIGNILYLEVLKQDGCLERRDFIDGYNPIHGDAKKLGLV